MLVDRILYIRWCVTKLFMYVVGLVCHTHSLFVAPPSMIDKSVTTFVCMPFCRLMDVDFDIDEEHDNPLVVDFCPCESQNVEVKKDAT